MKTQLYHIIRSLYSLVLTVIAWIFPVALLAVLNKDIPSSDIFVAYKTGNLFVYLMVSVFLLGIVHWLLNRITDLPNIRKQSMGLIIGFRFFSFIVILALYDTLDIMSLFDE